MIEPANAMPLRDELRDGLIGPAYRQFCRDNGFNLQGCDIGLQAEAMALFNQCKPHYSYFRGHVVHFHVWSWDWDFLQTTQSVEEFLAQAAQDQARLKRFEMWFGIIADLFVCSLSLVFMLVCDRLTNGALPGWLVPVVFTLAGCMSWRWFFVKRPRNNLSKSQEKLANQLAQFRQKLADIQISKEIKKSGLAEVAGPKLGEALAEHALAREAEDPNDPEMRRYLLHDLNDLLNAACPAGTYLQSSQFNHPTQLRAYLEASMELPAQTLAEALPNRLTTWLKTEPPANHPDRAQWVEQGRFLLDQARLKTSDMA